MPIITRLLRQLVAVASVAVAASPTLAADPSPTADMGLPDEMTASVHDASDMSLADARVIRVDDARIIALSPDGRSMAVTRQSSGSGGDELCVLELESMADLACADLSPLQAGLRPDDVTWSPDGRSLAFTERVFETFMDGDLWLMDTASGELTNLLDDGFEGPLPIMQRESSAAAITVPVNPVFSPDGTALAFSRSSIENGAMAGNDIVRLPLDGGDPERLWVIDPQLMGVAYMGIGWAPNGEQLYVSVSHPGGPDEADGIWAVDVSDGDSRQLVGRQHPGGSAPALLQVAGDGRHLLAYDPSLYGGRADGAPPLALVDLGAGTASALVSSGETAAPSGPASWAGFSPDGRALVTLVVSGDSGSLSVRDLGGSNEFGLPLPAELARLAATGPAAHRSAGSWSRDGRLLLPLAGDPGSALLLQLAAGSATGTGAAGE